VSAVTEMWLAFAGYPRSGATGKNMTPSTRLDQGGRWERRDETRFEGVPKRRPNLIDME